MKIYVAGKITGLSRREVEGKFRATAETLRNEGHDVFIPSVLPMYDSVPHEDYMHVCYAMIDICDAVYMMTDWQQSKGARMELQYAADWRKEILYEDESTREPNYPIMSRPPR
ncbi:MAG: DUF4406 domain-containing protein [Treponema sp.]|nr:DUF4406 domain-containing protein [Treponema sp.]